LLLLVVAVVAHRHRTIMVLVVVGQADIAQLEAKVQVVAVAHFQRNRLRFLLITL